MFTLETMFHLKTRPLRYAFTLMFAAMAVIATLIVVRPASAETTQETFIKSLVPGALQSWTDYRVPPSVTISQAILETGWGKSTLATQYNNYFGIKCSSTTSPYQSGCADVTTTEYDANGNKYTTVASFRTYANPGMSMIDHGYFLAVNSRYKPAFDYSDDSVKFAQAIQKAGYATDPNYAHFLYRLMSTYNLFQYDQGMSLGSAPDPATTAAAAAPAAAPSSTTSSSTTSSSTTSSATTRSSTTSNSTTGSATPKVVKAATTPAVTAADQSAPAQSAPAQSAPAQSAPEESAPVVSAVGEQSAPAQSAPAQSAPAQSAPAQSAPAQTEQVQPAQQAPEATEPAAPIAASQPEQSSAPEATPVPAFPAGNGSNWSAPGLPDTGQ